MPQVPLYIPVPIQYFVSLLYFVSIGKKNIASSQAIPKVGNVYWGSKVGLHHTCLKPLSFSKYK